MPRWNFRSATALFPILLLSAPQDQFADRIERLQNLTAASEFEAARTVAAGLRADVERTGPPHPAAAYAWNQIAVLDHTLGRYVDAERTYSRGLRALDREGAAPPPGLELLLLNLATLYLDTGVRPAQAEMLVRRALELAEARAGSQDPELGRFLSVLGGARLAQGDRRGARQHFELALRFGGDRETDKVRRAGVLVNLGVLSALEKQFQKAQEYLERAAALRAEASAETHPDLGGMYLNLALLHERQKHWERAGEYAARARTIVVSRLGPQHPVLVEILRVLGTALRKQGQRREARQLDRQRKALSAALPVDAAGQAWIHVADLATAAGGGGRKR